MMKQLQIIILSMLMMAGFGHKACAQKKLRKNTLLKKNDQRLEEPVDKRGEGAFQTDLFLAHRLDVALGYFMSENGYSLGLNGGFFITGDIIAEATIIRRSESLFGSEMTRTGGLLGGKYLLVTTGPFAFSGGLGLGVLNQELRDFETAKSIENLAIGPYMSSEVWLNVHKGFSLVLRGDIMFLMNQDLPQSSGTLRLNQLGLMIRKRI